jgi:hypothetical protein
MISLEPEPSALEKMRKKGAYIRARLKYRSKPETKQHHKEYMREYMKKRRQSPVHCCICNATFNVSGLKDWELHKQTCIGFKGSS